MLPRLLVLAILAACGPAPADTTGANSTTQATTTAETTLGPGGATTGVCLGEPATSTQASLDDPTEGSTMLCPDHARVDACCCFSTGSPTPPVVCPRHDLCPQIVIDTIPSVDVTTACPAAIDCALAAVLAGQPGTLRWLDPHAGDGYSEGMEIHLLGDGTAFISRSLVDDSGCSNDVSRHKLREPSVFTNCAEQATAIERFACLRDPVFSTALEACDTYFGCPSD